jgi:5-(carboxyamino)imidazole ribonucleotide mutase
MSPLPVIGVGKSSNSIDGWDSILSILQMPGGVPVATVALNGAKTQEFWHSNNGVTTKLF